jgi:signal transduction histidine kinase
MTVVMGYADVLAESLPDEETRLARKIESRSEALVDLGEKARELESMMQSAPDAATSVTLAGVVDEVVADVVSHGVDADVEIDIPQELTLETNVRVLEAVLGTVVENAIEHNDDPSPWVRVSASAATADGGDSIDDGIVVEVHDDGPGIPDHELAVVDDGRETPLSHGSGLGLWIVQWGSRWLGADVDFETDGVRGTTVRFRF